MRGVGGAIPQLNPALAQHLLPFVTLNLIGLREIHSPFP